MSTFLDKFGLKSSTLKWIAIITMFLNHLCYSLHLYIGLDSYFFTQAHWYLTRIAFVIFAFQIAEGMHYTHDKIKYILYIFIFAAISEIPFDLLFNKQLVCTTASNVLWTLGFGATAIALIDKFNKKPLISMVITMLAMMVCFAMRSDYMGLGVITVVSFYYFRDKKWQQLLFTAILFAIFTFIFYVYNYYCNGSAPIDTLKNERFWALIVKELHALAAWPLIMLYNGKKGKNVNKWFFYIFYPAHIALIYIVCKILAAIL